jgi:hypothetical protein
MCTGSAYVATMKITNKMQLYRLIYYSKSASTCFWLCLRPSSGALDCIYSIWYCSPKLLPTGVSNELKVQASSTCCRRCLHPSSGALDCICNIWYCSLKLLLASVSNELKVQASSNCFGRSLRPSSGAFDCIYSIW